RASRRRVEASRRSSPSSARCSRASPPGERPSGSRGQTSFFFPRRRSSSGRGRRRLLRGWFSADPDAVRVARPLAPCLWRRQVLRDLFLRAAGKHAVRVFLDIPTGRGEVVALLDQQPLVAFAPVLHVDEREIALQLLAVQMEFEVAARDLLLAVGLAEQLK